MPVRCDVLVVGGGPAGSAAAITLQARGIGALVVERGAYDQARAGETLLAGARRALTALGVWEEFVGNAAIPAAPPLSSWGDGRVRERPASLDGGEHGWHIERPGFDAMLARAAERAGALVYCGVAATGVTRAGRRWRMSLKSRATRTDVDAGWVVDASGRSAWVARQLGARRISYDRLLGIAGRYQAPLADARLFVESASDGWWYSAPVPGGSTVAVYLTDSDALAGRDYRVEYHERLASASETCARLRELGRPSLRVAPAATQSVTPNAGDRWIAAGDAAFALDPLSGSGILRALAGGISAGSAVAAALHGNGGMIEWVRRRTGAAIARELAERRRQYGREACWPQSQFWRRRHG